MRRRRAEGPSLLKGLRRLRGDTAGTLNCCCLVRRRLLRRRLTACAGRIGNSAGRAHNVANTAEGLLICANAASRRLLCRGPRCLCSRAKIGRRLRRP